MSNPGLIKTYTTKLPIERYRLVAWDAADGEVKQASAATDALIGSVDLAATAGRVDVIRSGIAEIQLGAAVTRGDRLTSDTEGKAITAAAGDRSIGFADVSGVAGDVIPVFVIPG